MRKPVFDEPFEDEDLEARAWEHFERAREAGSVLSDDLLIKECRELAQRDKERLEATGAEPVAQTEEEERGNRKWQ